MSPAVKLYLSDPIRNRITRRARYIGMYVSATILCVYVWCLVDPIKKFACMPCRHGVNVSHVLSSVSKIFPPGVTRYR